MKVERRRIHGGKTIEGDIKHLEKDINVLDRVMKDQIGAH